MEDHPLFDAYFGATSRVTPKTCLELETLGKRASARFERGETNLTRAVADAVKTAGLGPEHIRRVVEFANTNSFLDEFSKEGAPHRYVHFAEGPADADAVMAHLEEEAQQPLVDTGDADYVLPPTDVAKLARDNGDAVGAGLDFAELFPSSADSGDEAPDDPLRELVATERKVAQLCATRAARLEVAQGAVNEARTTLAREAKIAALEGVPLGDIVRAWSTVATSPGAMKRAFAIVRPALSDVFDSDSAVRESMGKSAGGGVVNDAHPLVSALSDLGTAEASAETLSRERDALARVHHLVEHRMKQAMKKDANRVMQGVRWLTGNARSLGGKAQSKLEPLVGERASKVVGGAIRYTPHAAGALATEEVYQRSKKTRTGRAVRNFAAGRVPGTNAYDHRMYRYGQ